MSALEETIQKKILQQSFGTQAAPTPVTTTNATACVATTFQVWEADTRIASITINGTAITAFSAIDLPAGFCVYGLITTVTLGQGAGLAYTGNNAGI